MLGNNEPIKGLDPSEVFSDMIGELPWRNLRIFVQANAQLYKMCTSGGHRLEPKLRKRIEQRIVQEAANDQFSAAFTNGVFAQWYPVHEELHKRLEDYFHSEDYTKHRQEHGFDEDTYVLPEDVFNHFFHLPELIQWRILLCFSPLQFTQKQAEVIVAGEGENAILLERILNTEQVVEQLRKELQQNCTENQRLQREHEKAVAAAQETRKERRDLISENRTVLNKFEASQAENRRLHSENDELRRLLAAQSLESRTQREQEVGRIKEQLQQRDRLVEDWRNRYELQCAQQRKLDEALQVVRKECAEQQRAATQAQEEINRLSSFADLILRRMDWAKIGAQMKLAPTLKRQFNNLIKSLDYEQDKTLTIEGTLPEFWNRMINSEKQLVQTIADSNIREVQNGAVADFWRELTDDFEDIFISLEARAMLLRMLQEIFYQTLEMEDLQEPKIPRKK